MRHSEMLKRLALLVTIFFLLSAITQAAERKWTDFTAGIQLQELRKDRTKQNIEGIIAIGRDGPEAELLQNEVFAALADTGPSTLGDNYVKEVLDSTNSPEMMKFGALGYLLAAPRDWMKSYAAEYLLSSQTKRLQVVASYLAMKLNVNGAEAATRNLIADNSIGNWRLLALYSLAEVLTPESLAALAKDNGLPNFEIYHAMSYAGFRLASDATKIGLLEKWISTRQPMLESQALRYVFKNELTEQLIKLNIVYEGDALVNGEAPMAERWRILARKLGYRLLGSREHLSIEQINPEQIN